MFSGPINDFAGENGRIRIRLYVSSYLVSRVRNFVIRTNTILIGERFLIERERERKIKKKEKKKKEGGRKKRRKRRERGFKLRRSYRALYLNVVYDTGSLPMETCARGN